MTKDEWERKVITVPENESPAHRAWRLTIKMWIWLAETGKEKWQWDDYDGYRIELEGYHGCFLCANADAKVPDIGCARCLYHKYNNKICYANKSNYSRWENSLDASELQYYADLFLKELQAIPEPE